jgi:hypothetical protein
MIARSIRLCPHTFRRCEEHCEPDAPCAVQREEPEVDAAWPRRKAIADAAEVRLRIARGMRR